MEKCIICIDAGGTKTLGIVYKEDKTEIAKIRLGCGSPAVDEKLAFENINNAINHLLNEVNDKYNIDLIICGISGLGIVKDVDVLEQVMSSQYGIEVKLYNDAITSLYSIITDKYESGVLVLAGTGSAIYGVNDSKTVLVGGYGHLLGERGSAYSLVQQVALRIIERYENGEEQTPFTTKFFEYLGINDVYGFKKIFYQKQKAEIAGMAKYVKEQAYLGDKESEMYLMTEGEQLANQVSSVIKLCGIKEQTVLGLRGGFFIIGDHVIKGFKNRLSELEVKYILNNEELEPIEGVYYLAKKYKGF